MARRPSKPGSRAGKAKGTQGQGKGNQPKPKSRTPDIKSLSQQERTELLRQLAAAKGRSEKQIADVAAKLEELYNIPTEGIELKLADQTSLKAIQKSLNDGSSTDAQIKKLDAIYNNYIRKS